jgi:hypothetical protein
VDDIEVTDLCTERADIDSVTTGPVLVCTLADDGHHWHWDPLEDVTWRRGTPGECQASLSCQLPADCVNGPGPHPFIPPLPDADLPCCRQPWEARHLDPRPLTGGRDRQEKEDSMSFSYAAAGRKDDVIAQLALVRGDELATDMAAHITRHVKDAPEYTHTDENGTEKAYGYIVEVSGHSWAGSQPSLSASLKGAYFPVVPAGEPQATGADGSIAGD